MYRNTRSVCFVARTNIVLQVSYTSKTNKQTSKLIEKDIGYVVARGRGWREGELDEDSQKVQSFSYKMNKQQGYNVQQDKYN